MNRVLSAVRVRTRRQVAILAALLAAVSLVLVAVASSHGGTGIAPPPPAFAGPAVSGVVAVPSHFQSLPDPAKREFTATATTWPAAAQASIRLAGHDEVRSGAPGTPVWAQLSGPGSVDASVAVQVFDHARAVALGVPGVVFSVTPQGVGAGALRVGLDYKAFAQAIGGNFGARLRLVQLPACALTTPDVPSCRSVIPLTSSNSTVSMTVSAPIAPSLVGGGRIVLATTTDPGTEGGAGGSYAATDLKPSGSWVSGGSTGSFDYTYPIELPAGPAAIEPKVSLNYDSGSVDGSTASTQSQASWVGEGWSTPRSYIEQTFIACSDNPEGSASPVSTSDLCFNGPILTLSLNGSTTSLVWDAASSTYRPQTDDGSVVAHITNSGNGSGTYNQDYWTVTTRDGIVYSFGRNHLPGWTSGKPATNSVDWVPVYSAHSGDPCFNASGFTSSSCLMANRWNLDYVKDLHGNAMALYYTQDTNYYGQDNGAQNSPYVRDSHLTRADYGFLDGQAYGTVPDQVVYTTGDRCLSGTCQPLNSATKANWPDVPFDLVCASGATCSSFGPGFFSTVRLTGITTQQWSTASSAYLPVDSYALTQTIPVTGDGTSPTLWLSSVTRTGQATTSGSAPNPVTLPPVSFTGVQLQNRVDSVTDGLPAYYKYRLATITTESGSVIAPTYALPNPCTAPVTLNPATNTSSCFPVSWTPPGMSQPFTDWFNKYAVTHVTQTDPTGGAPAVATSYVYQGGAAWHFDDNEVVQAKYRTYGQFRGYATVQTLTGDGSNDPQTLSTDAFYRGMSKNNNSTVVNVTDSLGGNHEDVNELAGKTLETTQYQGNGGPVDHSTITSYWVSGATATRNRTGLPALTARWIQPAEVYTRQAVTSSGSTTWRYLETDNTYDATLSSATVGLLQRTYTHTMPVNTAYDQCVNTTYAAVNASANLVGLAAEAETDSVACGGFTAGSPASVPGALNSLTAPASVSRPAQVVTDIRSFYDDPTWSTTFPQTAAPTKGDNTMTRRASTYTAGAFVYQTTGRATYDSHGRKTASYDGNGGLTSTAYTDNTVGLTTAITVTNALNHTNSATLDPRRALTLTTVDANGVTATQQYDAMGRQIAVWLASRPTTSPANVTMAYTLSNTGISATTTNKLNDESGYQTTVQIDDALLRPRQTQTITPQSGRMVTDTFYDSRGWKSATNNGWWDSATTPTTTLVSAANLQASVPDRDEFSYDGLGRVVYDRSLMNGTVISTTTTVYNGDQSTTVPPAGGVVSRTLTDPLGRTTELDQFKTAPTVVTPANTVTGTFTITGGTFNAATYGYDGHGRQASTTDATGATRTTTFNLLGQATAITGPDSGTQSNILYDGNGNVVQSTDGRGKTLSYTFDANNRRTAEYASALGSQSSANQYAAWVYDNSNNAVTNMANPLGHLTTSISYSGGAAYTSQQKGFNVFGEPTGVTVTIPSGEGALGASYTFSKVYTSTTGLLLKEIYPAAGGLPAETVLHGYAGALDLPNTIGGLTGYAQGTTYDAFKRVNQETIGAGSNLAYLTDTWDTHTGRLTDELVTRAVATPSTVDDEAYQYDLAGNLTRQVDTHLGSSATAETQCFAMDGLARLTAAWTATDNCATTPTSANHSMVGDNLGTASSYWTEWGLNDRDDRTSQIQHSVTGGTDTTTTYTYNGNGTNQPDTLTASGTTGGSTGSTSYSYDTAGNMVTRSAGQGNQTLTWNDSDQLTAITGGTAGNSAYVYNGDGDLLLQKDPGTTTLYLPNEQLALNTGTGVVTGSRYITLPGGGICVRTGTGSNYTFQLGDVHGSPSLYLDSTAQTPTWRQLTPYGAARGSSVTAPDNHGFLNKPTSTATGLTIVGARSYDSATGRFISVDSIFVGTDPLSWNGYSYANNTPASRSDPSGQRITDCDDACRKTMEEQRREGEEQQKTTDNDVDAPCDSGCAQRRMATDAQAQAKARASLTQSEHCIAILDQSACPVMPDNYIVAEVTDEGPIIDIGPLTDIRISEDYGAANEDTETITKAQSQAQSWSTSTSAKLSFGIKEGDLNVGGELSASATYTSTETNTLTNGMSYKIPPGGRGYISPDVSIQWQKVTYYSVDTTTGVAKPVSTGWSMRIEQKGIYGAAVPAGGDVPTGNSPQDVMNAILNSPKMKG
jgi:RHS repeat-associated protein